MARKTLTAEQEMFAAFQRFMAAQSVPSTEVVPEPRKKATRSSGTPAKKINANRKATTTKASRSTPKGVITCGEAWTLLGADPTYRPSDPSAPARNNQLWRLNSQGKLRVV